MIVRKQTRSVHEGSQEKQSILERAEETVFSAERSLERTGKKTFVRLSIKQAALLGGVLLLIMLFITGWRAYTILRQDLTLTLSPEAAALTLTHGEEASVEFSLRTNNLVLCTAECTYRIVRLSDGSVAASQQGIRMQDEYRFFMNITAPSKGEGQLLYGVDATCQNVRKALCAREEERHSTRALVTVEYTLTEEEWDARSQAQEAMPPFLAAARAIDEEAQRIASITAQLGTSSLDGLEDEAAGVLEEQAAVVSETARLIKAWENEEYAEIIIDNQHAFERAQHAKSVRQRLEQYVTIQHKLVDDATSAGTLLSLANATYATLIAFESAGASYRTAALSASAQLAMIEQGPTQAVLSRAAALERALVILNASTAKARSALAQDIVGAVLREERARLFALNASNRTMPGLTPIPEDLNAARWATIARCEELDALSGELASLNVSLLATSQAMKEPCLAIKETTFLVATPRTPAAVTVEVLEVSSSIPPAPAAYEARCCALGVCAPCCTDASCRKLPVLFLHGHSSYVRNDPSYSAETFRAFQESLEKNGTSIDAGVLTPYSAYAVLPTGGWGAQATGVSAGGTYYYDAYLSGGSYILSAAKSESIDTYAIRFKDLVETLRQRAGTERVIIVAHSMGGLVARRYLQLFGTEHVETLIMIGTPNQGVESSVATLCPVIGASKECEEMQTGSPFLAKLNDPSLQPDVISYSIVGSGCEMGKEDGDGVVLRKNAELPWIDPIVVNGTCSPLEKLHTTIVDPARHPEVFSIVEELIRSHGG